MSFKRGFALGDAYGPEVFFEGAEIRDALKEAERFYPRHTAIHFDGDLKTLASEEGDEFAANADPSKMPIMAHRMSGLGTYDGDEVLRMSVEEAHRILLPFFQVKIQAGQHKGKIVKAYDTVGAMRANFLTENAKLGKAVKGVRSLGVKPGLSRGPNLLPHRLAFDLSKKRLPMSGLGFCVGSNEACRSTCLVYTGNNPVADSQVPVKLARSEALVKEPVAWLRMFVSAIEWHVAYCRERRLKPYVRPNVLSDIPWELVFPDIFDIFPRIQHYDYTKVAGRVEGAANYDLTFSFSGTNSRLVEHELKRGHRVAVVFWLEKPCARYKKSKICDNPSDLTFLGHKVIDGDTHDFRPLDPAPSVIGLSFKIPMVAGRRLTKAHWSGLQVCGRDVQGSSHGRALGGGHASAAWRRRGVRARRADRGRARMNEAATEAVCQVCKVAYTEGVYNKAQANGCASMFEVQGDRAFVLSCYGSKHDCDCYEFLRGVPAEWHDADPICDACIDVAVRTGLFGHCHGNYMWGLRQWPSGIIGDGEPEPRVPPSPMKAGDKFRCACGREQAFAPCGVEGGVTWDEAVSFGWCEDLEHLSTVRISLRAARSARPRLAVTAEA